MFGFTKKCFFTGLVFLSTLISINLLSCTIKNVKLDHKLLILMGMNLCFLLLVLKCQELMKRDT